MPAPTSPLLDLFFVPHRLIGGGVAIWVGLKGAIPRPGAGLLDLTAPTDRMQIGISAAIHGMFAVMAVAGAVLLLCGLRRLREGVIALNSLGERIARPPD